MQFGTVPIDQAEGAILAHSANLRGGALRKGKLLEAADIARLIAEGWSDVIVARLGPDDMHEDRAAAGIAAALVPDPAGQGLRLSPATTGRVNVHATAAGILHIDLPAILAVNRINPLITLATVPALQRVGEGMMVATVKIIAYAVPQGDVARAVAVAAAGLRVLRPTVQTATLIETVTHDDMPAIKGREALRMRLARLGLRLSERVVIPHQAVALATAIQQAPGQVVFILTASATSDPYDVAPQGLRQAGGTVTHFGMPVDPGNLLFFGQHGTRPVIGLPGCARSPALNGADWVMERLICGLTLTPDDIAAMAVGGLLKEIPTRPRPRDAASVLNHPGNG